jgi:hypothetical protein
MALEEFDSDTIYTVVFLTLNIIILVFAAIVLCLRHNKVDDSSGVAKVRYCCCFCESPSNFVFWALWINASLATLFNMGSSFRLMPLVAGQLTSHCSTCCDILGYVLFSFNCFRILGQPNSILPLLIITLVIFLSGLVDPIIHLLEDFDVIHNPDMFNVYPYYLICLGTLCFVGGTPILISMLRLSGVMKSLKIETDPAFRKYTNVWRNFRALVLLVSCITVLAFAGQMYFGISAIISNKKQPTEASEYPMARSAIFLAIQLVYVFLILL